MAYIGKNPKLKSIVSEGDTLANLTAEPRVAGRLVYATDEQKFYYDDGAALNEVGSGSGGGIPLLSKGSLLTSNGTSNGEFIGADGEILVWDSSEPSGLRSEPVPTGGGGASDSAAFNFEESTVPSARNWRDMVYDGSSTYVAVNNNGAAAGAMYSLNGHDWINSTTPTGGWNGVAYGNGVFVAVGSSGTNRVMTSSDGISWAATPSANDTYFWSNVIFAQNLFVAVSFSPGAVMTSPDGITWTLQSVTNNAWNSLTYGNGVFVAVAISGTNRVMTSPDGITWTDYVSANEAQGWKDVAYGNGIFLAVSGNVGGSIMYSSDNGVTWTETASVIAAESVAFGAGYFVFGHNAGTTFYRTSDGINVFTAYVAASRNWRATRFANSQFFSLVNGTADVMRSERP